MQRTAFDSIMYKKRSLRVFMEIVNGFADGFRDV